MRSPTAREAAEGLADQIESRMKAASLLGGAQLREAMMDLGRLVYVESTPIITALRSVGTEGGETRGAGLSGDGWQPAETAPTNRAIQVYIPRLDYYGNDGVYAGMLVDMGTGPHWMTFAWAMGRDMAGENRPTHWRDLPAAPVLHARTTDGGDA